MSKVWFVDLLESTGRMRRLPLGKDTLPHDWNNMLESLGDCVTVYPVSDANTSKDTDNCDIDSSPWLTRRRCRRKEKGPIHPESSNQATTAPSNSTEAIILETCCNGGNPIPDDPNIGPIDDSFSTPTKAWRGNTTTGHSVSSFFAKGANLVLRHSFANCPTTVMT